MKTKKRARIFQRRVSSRGKPGTCNGKEATGKKRRALPSDKAQPNSPTPPNSGSLLPYFNLVSTILKTVPSLIAIYTALGGELPRPAEGLAFIAFALQNLRFGVSLVKTIWGKLQFDTEEM